MSKYRTKLSNRQRQQQKIWRDKHFVQQQGKCFYCLKLCLDPSVLGHYSNFVNGHDLFTLDHIHPISKGGIDAEFNTLGACGHCNGIRENHQSLFSVLLLVRKQNSTKFQKKLEILKFYVKQIQAAFKYL